MKRNAGYKGRVRSLHDASLLSIPGWCHCCERTLTQKCFNLLILCHLRPLPEQSGRELWCSANGDKFAISICSCTEPCSDFSSSWRKESGLWFFHQGPITHQGAKQSTLCNQLHEKNQIIFPENVENRIETLLLLCVLCFCTGYVTRLVPRICCSP